MAEHDFHLKLSHYEAQRNTLLKTLTIPTLSEVTNILGKNLSNIVFDQCIDDLKKDFGLEPPLKGYWGDMWTSPSDLLIGKVALKPPLTRKHIQALTHWGILKIGADIENKFLNLEKIKHESQLAYQKRAMLESFNDIIKEEIKDVEARERANCQREIEKLTEEFEGRLENELNDLEQRLRSQYEEIIQGQKANMQNEWQHLLKKEVDDTVKSMTEKFLQEINKQVEVFQRQLKSEQVKAHHTKTFYVNLEQHKCKEQLNHMRHELECKHLANMMYLICMERRKCMEEKEALQKSYEEKLKELNDASKNTLKRIDKLRIDVETERARVNLRESCIMQVIKEFQKFINYALKAAPTQAEFLLSTEKMMLFELMDAIPKSPHLKPKPCRNLMRWRKPQTRPEETLLEVHDNHDCLNELWPPKPASERFLPAFYYKDKLYVREDFRNMISQNLAISPSNELWNEDVDILMKTLKKSVSSFVSADNRPVEKLVQAGATSTRNTPNVSRRVSLDEHVIGMLPHKTLSKMGSLKMSRTLDVSIVDYTGLSKVENNPYLLATRSSVELWKEKISMRSNSIKEELDTLRGENLKDDNNIKVKKKQAVNNADKSDKTEEASLKRATVTESNIVLGVQDSLLIMKKSLAKMSHQQIPTSMDDTNSNQDQVSIYNVGEMPKDSLILTREKSLVSTTPKTKHDSKSKERVIDKETCKDICLKPCSDSKNDLGEAGKVSIMVIPPEEVKSVIFEDVPTVMRQKESIVPDKLVSIYKTKKSKQDVKKKVTKCKTLQPPSVVKVLGDPAAKEHLQDVNEFTMDRIESLLNIMKDCPELLRTFTACRR